MGYTKNAYEKFIFETRSELTGYVNSIYLVLPLTYSEKDIIDSIIKYYPFEWRVLNERYREYCKSDKKLKKIGKKQRYLMDSPEKIVCSLEATKNLLSDKKRMNIFLH